MTRVVLTAFEPFGGHGANSSFEVGRAVARRPPPGVEVHWLVLPVVAGACVEHTWSCLDQTRPALVLALGQATGAARLRLEQVAVNVNDFSLPDNAGNQPRRQLIVPGGPAAYHTTAATRPALRALRRENIPAEHSLSAGTYVCNHLFYGLLHRAVLAGAEHHTGFLHLPLLPGQVRRKQALPSCPLAVMAEGVRRTIATMVHHATRATLRRPRTACPSGSPAPVTMRQASGSAAPRG